MEAVHDCHMHDAGIAQEIVKVTPVDLISEMEAVHDCHIQYSENMKENISDIAHEIVKVTPVDLISEMEAVHDCHIQNPENTKENISDNAHEIVIVTPVDSISEMEALHDCHIQDPQNVIEHTVETVEEVTKVTPVKTALGTPVNVTLVTPVNLVSATQENIVCVMKTNDRMIQDNKGTDLPDTVIRDLSENAVAVTPGVVAVENLLEIHGCLSSASQNKAMVEIQSKIDVTPVNSAGLTMRELLKVTPVKAEAISPAPDHASSGRSYSILSGAPIYSQKKISSSLVTPDKAVGITPFLPVVSKEIKLKPAISNMFCQQNRKVSLDSPHGDIFYLSVLKPDLGKSNLTPVSQSVSQSVRCIGRSRYQ